MVADDAGAEERDQAWAVSMEVDGRQKYLFETDKLQEMVGASAIMRQLAEEARERERAEEPSIHVFQPASGEVRAWSTDRTRLLSFAWKLREWLTGHGVEHTAVLLRCGARHFTCDKTEEQQDKAERAREDARNRADVDRIDEPEWPDLAWVHGALTALARRVKDAKAGPDARPTCSLFEACRIHGFDFANEWNPNEEVRDGGEKRRALRGYRARAKFDARQADRLRYIDRDLMGPLYDRARALLSDEKRDETLRTWVERHLAPGSGAAQGHERAITIGNLVLDPTEWFDAEGRTDQFVAFVCADGDGMGRLLTGLDWNLPAWSDELLPWERNQQFSRALDEAVSEAFRAAVARVTLPDRAALERLREAETEKRRFIIPVLPQLLGGDDLWTVARKDVALPLCRTFAADVLGRIEQPPILQKAMELSKPASDENLTPTMSQGIAFAKAGHPVHAMIEAAESLLDSAKALRKGAAWQRRKPTEGCLDWHWIESSLSETVGEARARGAAYVAPDTGDVMLLTTRPWTLTEAARFERAAERFRNGVPRRKREQLDDILRRGHVLSLVAWEAWWKRLRECEQRAVGETSIALGEEWRLPAPDDLRAGREAPAWGKHLTSSPWICRGKAAMQGQEENREHRHYYVTPLLDLLALDNLAGFAGGEATGGGSERTTEVAQGPAESAEPKTTERAHA